jgi:SAM domain (Sterile alpha motif)
MAIFFRDNFCESLTFLVNLSPLVPLWTAKEVGKWLEQIGFSDYKQKFFKPHIDGDLLLQLTDEMLIRTLEMTSEIQRKRIERELRNLLQIADYSSMDPMDLSGMLKRIGPEYNVYSTRTQC